MSTNWIPLVEYSFKTKLSLSTLRRYIKANKVRHMLVDGRYMILDESESEESISAEGRSPVSEVQLTQALKEIEELKTLVAYYEEILSEKERS